MVVTESATWRWQSERWSDKHDEWQVWTVGSLEDCLEDLIEAKWKGVRARLTYEPDGVSR